MRLDPQDYPLAFPVFFVAMWFGVTTLLGLLSGWYGLMRRYRNRPEMPTLTLSGQSATMGIVGMRGVLRISVCPSGLRFGMMRVFGPFCRDFFVPWEDISATRKKRLVWNTVVLRLGSTGLGRVSLLADVADRLARASSGRWPEPGSFPIEPASVAASRIVKEWLAMTTLAAAFFIIAPRITAPVNVRPPVLVAILFPAVVFGVVSLVRYLRRDR